MREKNILPNPTRLGLIRVRLPAMQTTRDPALISLNGFGAAMRDARKAKGWTQKELAQFAGVNPETIVRIENGGNTRVTTMSAIRRVLPDVAANNGQETVHAAEAQRLAAESMAIEQTKHDIEELREQVIHMVRAVMDPSLLINIRGYALRQLNTQANAPHPKFGGGRKPRRKK